MIPEYQQSYLRFVFCYLIFNNADWLAISMMIHWINSNVLFSLKVGLLNPSYVEFGAGVGAPVFP